MERLPTYRDERDRAAAEAPQVPEREVSDPYRGAPLGVECAWPGAREREEMDGLRF